MIYVLKMDFMNLKNPKQFIPGKILQVFSLLDGCCLQLPHLGKTVQHLQIYLSFGVGVTYILNTIQEHFQSPMHVIHKFSFFHEEFLIMSYQNGTLFEFDTFCAFVILNESQISLFIFRLHLVVLIFRQHTHQSISRFGVQLHNSQTNIYPLCFQLGNRNITLHDDKQDYVLSGLDVYLHSVLLTRIVLSCEA